MILLLDASSYLKLYVAEPGTGVVKKLVREAAAIFAPQSTYVEARAILTRAVTVGVIREKLLAGLEADFERDWAGTNVIVPDQAMLRDAAALVQRHGLNVERAQNVAAAVRITREFPTGTLIYCTADAFIQATADTEGIHTVITSSSPPRQGNS